MAPINYRQLRSLTAREIANALVRDGFQLLRQNGSHRQYGHEATKRRVTLAYHSSGQTFSVDRLRRMIEAQAQWTEADLIRLGLLHD